MKYTYSLCSVMFLCLAGVVMGASLDGTVGPVSIESSGGGSVNLTGCLWDFSVLTVGDNYLYVNGLTVSGAKTISYSFTKNYTGFTSSSTCTTFVYGEMSGAAVAPARYTMIAYTYILPLFGALFLISVIVPLIIFIGQTLGYIGDVNWKLILGSFMFLCIGAVMAGALTIGLVKMAGG